jgi:hypothetical protein
MHRVRIVALVSLVTVLFALAIVPPAFADTRSNRVIKFEGVVVSGPDVSLVESPHLGEWVIHVGRRLRTITITERTRVIENHGDFKVGAYVKVIARMNEDGDLVALVVQVRPHAPRIVVFRGFVKELDPTDPPGWMVVLGRKVLLTDETVIQGRLREGALVQVVAKVDGQTITALRVKVLPWPHGQVITIRGRIQEMDSDPTTYIKLWGREITVNEDTRVEGELREGAYVKARVLVRNGDLTALHIKVYELQITPRPYPLPVEPVEPEPPVSFEELESAVEI